MVEAVDYASLPEFKPASEYNAQLLNNLRVFAYCDEHKLAKRIPVMSISGHVDSGKSTTLSLCLRELGVIEESVFEAVEKEVAEKAQANSSGVDPLGNIAKIVEKGKEAKERGITIETRVWRVYLTNYMRLKKGSAECAEARKLLEQLKWEYKVTEEGDLEVFCYKTPMDLIDCPGHKDFIHNTSAAIMETDTQIVLFPNSSGEATGQGEDPFLKMLDPKHSLSIAHAHLGFTSGNMMIFCISKSDMNWSLVPERLELLKTSIKKKVGIPNVVLLPISNTNKKAQNMVQKSEMPEFNFFKGVEANLKIPDWRNPKTQYKVTYHLNSVFDAIRVQSVIVSHREQYEGKGTMMQIKNVAKIAHGYVMIGVILNGALSKGDIVRSARWGQDLKVETMEQFNKDVEVSSTGSHIGIKVKAIDRKFEIKSIGQGDLFYRDYPADNVPIYSQYAIAKFAYSHNIIGSSAQKSDKKTKTSFERKIGNSGLLIMGQRHTVQIVHVYSKTCNKHNKDKEHANNKDIWYNGDMIQCVIKFTKKVTVPNIDQCHFGATCGFLEHHNPVATCKLVKQLPQEEGEKLDEPQIAKDSKVNKRQQQAGKGKKK